jgi:hypothetical protein
MDENFIMIWYMLHKYSLEVSGFMLFGVSGMLLAHIQLKMLKLGHKFPYAKYLTKSNWDIRGEYLRIRSQHGWSPWPAYLIWPAAATGVLFLLLGYFSRSEVQQRSWCPVS